MTAAVWAPRAAAAAPGRHLAAWDTGGTIESELQGQTVPPTVEKC
ncbi:hypothetical protein [Streptomyces sp. IBSBF 2435]